MRRWARAACCCRRSLRASSGWPTSHVLRVIQVVAEGAQQGAVLVGDEGTEGVAALLAGDHRSGARLAAPPVDELGDATGGQADAAVVHTQQAVVVEQLQVSVEPGLVARRIALA